MPSIPTKRPDGALPVFVRYPDLVAAGVVANWTTLIRLIDEEGFPPGILIGSNTRAWRADLVEAWLTSRPTARKVLPAGCTPTRGRRRRAVEHGEHVG
jgi:predicted DNA-binding transcriptional regulator AlpA